MRPAVLPAGPADSGPPQEHALRVAGGAQQLQELV